jgi:hypothetical protein
LTLLGGVQFNFDTKTPGDSEAQSTVNTKFTGNVFVYHETYLSGEQQVIVSKAFTNAHLSPILRSIDYRSYKNLEDRRN